jgi:hypothetical protein
MNQAHVLSVRHIKCITRLRRNHVTPLQMRPSNHRFRVVSHRGLVTATGNIALVRKRLLLGTRWSSCSLSIRLKVLRSLSMKIHFPSM